jgi:cellulose synthase/poly-beta-1,6-N-acetylglucosamine synthase-like glycosyltransferase
LINRKEFRIENIYLLKKSMPTELCTLDDVVVCVPARDESEHIGDLLTSLSRQARLSNALKVVVVSNNSTDCTADVVRKFQNNDRLEIRLFEVDLPPEAAHVGTARRLAMNEGRDWLSAIQADGILISTDADAVVPSNWVYANIEALRHAEVVGGRLVQRASYPASSQVETLNRLIDRYWTAVRTLEERLDPLSHDPAPRHGDHTGASLAVWTSVYDQVGGPPALRSGEDRALVAAIERIGGRVRHCPLVSVEVSTRLKGRADGGMAQEMVRRRECAGPDVYQLPGALYWLNVIRQRAALRRIWTSESSPYPNAIAHVANLESGGDFPVYHAPIETCLRDLEVLCAGYASKDAG